MERDGKNEANGFIVLHFDDADRCNKTLILREEIKAGSQRL